MMRFNYYPNSDTLDITWSEGIHTSERTADGDNVRFDPYTKEVTSLTIRDFKKRASGDGLEMWIVGRPKLRE